MSLPTIDLKDLHWPQIDGDLEKIVDKTQLFASTTRSIYQDLIKSATDGVSSKCVGYFFKGIKKLC